MKILYLSCHETLEFDELSIFNEIEDLEVFPVGAYMNKDDDTIRTNNEQPPGLRPPIPGFKVNQDDLAAYHKCVGETLDRVTEDLLSGKILTKEFVDRFDAIMVMHVPLWINVNWEAIKHKTVIWRTIGQSVTHNENQLRSCRDEGMKIVRYSPMEENIPGYLGAEALIRFYKDPQEFQGWTGEDEKIMTLCQSMKSRGRFCNFYTFQVATKGFNRRLFGSRNEDSEVEGGELTYDGLKDEMRKSRVYFYTGTQPASYTLNFIEAWMTGCPMVCIGPNQANSLFRTNLYEIPYIIQNGINGFWSNNTDELRGYIENLMNDFDLAKKVSEGARRSALELFSREPIKQQWVGFFNNIKNQL